jgi:hypothetical protein
MRRPMLLLALGSTLLAGCATMAGGKGDWKEYKIDQIVPLGPDGSANVSVKTGPFEVVRVLVRNQPTAKDVAEDTYKRDRSHPKPTIVAKSNATGVAYVTLVSILEDENGTPLMTCNSRKEQDLGPGTTDDWNTCFMEGIRTQDWPKVKNFHAVVTFRVREAPAATK